MRYVVEYAGFTNRRPNPKTAEFVFMSGLSIPSFRYRSGLYSMGLIYDPGSCNMDLN